MINDRIIYRRLDKIQENVQLLRSLEGKSFDEFVSNSFYVSGSEHALQISIQAIIDICACLVREAQVHMPEEYGELPRILSELGVFPKEFAERLGSMIGMRNVLVHLYLQVDVSLVYEVIQKNLDDFDQFAKYVVAYLEKEGVA